MIVKTTVLAITVANGNIMKCDCYSPGFQWFMQDYEFHANLRILKLRRCDIVLGVDWLRGYSPILFDFMRMKFSFKKDRRSIELRGIGKEAELQEITVNKVHKKLKEVLYDFVGQFFILEAMEVAEKAICHPKIEALLQEFTVFAEPTQLSSVGSLNHKIPLIPGAEPVNIRPYKSSFIQKEEIDKLVKDMLRKGIIQHCSNPFASPVLLVKKKDST